MFNQECSFNVVKKQSDIQNVTHVTHPQNDTVTHRENVTACHTVKYSHDRSDKMSLVKCHLNVTSFLLFFKKKHIFLMSDKTVKMSRCVTVQKYKNIISKICQFCDILSDNVRVSMSLFVSDIQFLSKSTPIYKYIYRGVLKPPMYIYIYIQGNKSVTLARKNSKKIFAKIKNFSSCLILFLHRGVITCPGGHHAV